jgi:hypothetical protein
MKHVRSLGLVASVFAVLASCTNEQPNPGGTGGQAASSGGSSTGGVSGGSPSIGGSSTGGLSLGGMPLGGTSAGGVATGGTSTGGSSSGGKSTGGTAPAGGSSQGGTAGTAGATQCPDPPAGAPAAAVTAYNTINATRVAMGVPCDVLVLALCTSSQNHCGYYVTNQGSSTCQAASAHDEISGCPGFTGVSAGDREKAAGYTGNNWSECMAFLGDPVGSVTMFINSVYHRTPILSPWMRDVGYGSGTKCDTIDFGTGPTTPATVTAVYPYNGQTGVPTCFNGSREGPTPPAPSTGWPSGYPITIFARNLTVTTHTIVVDGTTTQLAHQWLGNDSTLGPSAKVLYTDSPLSANTTYRVTIDGTISSAAAHFEWTFTTGAASRC